MPFQNRRFDSDFLTIQHVLDAGYVGRPVELELHMDRYRPNDGVKLGSPIDGSWYGHGVHLADQIVALFGSPDCATYDLRATREPGATIDDQFEVNMFYGDTFKATVQATELAAVAYPKWVLHGTKGTYIKHNIDQQEYDLKTGIMPGMPGFGDDAPQDMVLSLTTIKMATALKRSFQLFMVTTVAFTTLSMTRWSTMPQS